MSIRVHNLSHAYGAKTALDNISFEVNKGRFCALLGPNGAGKSTLFALMTRLFVPSSGMIEIAGTEINNTPREALAKLGVVFQQPTLDLDLTVQQNLSYFAALQGISGKSAFDAIHTSLERLDMAERAKEKVRALNGGHRRRMEIARALIHQPEVLLLDEPTVGLDAQSRQAITGHVHNLADNDGITVLWATHLVDEVRPTDDLIVLHKGRVVAEGSCAKVIGRKKLATVFNELTQDEAA